MHTVVILLRPEAAHANLNGVIHYAPSPQLGNMAYRYEVVRLWERPEEELLAADVSVTPLAMLGRLAEGVSLEDGLTVVAGRFSDRLTREAPPDRVKKLLTDALLLTGLRVRRDVAARILRGVRIMQESDTYLMILDEGREKEARNAVLFIGEERWGATEESVKSQLSNITDLERLERMIRRAVKAANWQEILDTP